MIELLAYPFMQRAILAGVLLGALLAFLGIFVVLKRMAFFSDGIAHASLAGVALGILAQINPLPVALVFSAIISACIAWLERHTKITSDAIIGLIFTSGMAAGVVLLAFKSGYQPELVSFLFGDILALQWSELIIMAIFSSILMIFLTWQYKKIALMIMSPDIAYVNGVKVSAYEMLLYVIVAVSVVLGLKLLGIILVSALLIMPVSTAKLFAESFRRLIIWSIIISELTVLSGIVASVMLNLPTGAVMVLCGMIIFILTFVWQKLLHPKLNSGM